jgi:hypothetical protein
MQALSVAFDERDKVSDLCCRGIGVSFPHIRPAKVHAYDLAAKLCGEEVGALSFAAGHVKNANTTTEAQVFSEPSCKPQTARVE